MQPTSSHSSATGDKAHIGIYMVLRDWVKNNPQGCFSSCFLTQFTREYFRICLNGLWPSSWVQLVTADRPPCPAKPCHQGLHYVTKPHSGCSPTPSCTFPSLPTSRMAARQLRGETRSFHTQARSSRWEKNLPFLQVLLLLRVLILLCGGEKQNQTFDCTEGEKKRIRKEKECHTFEWFNRLQSLEQSSCQPLTWRGKAIQVQQHWRQEHN